MHDKVPGYTEALNILRQNMSQRAKALLSLEKHVDGTQYEDLPDWFSDKKPLWERAPCIVYPIVRSAIDSNTDLLLGEGRFPTAKVDGLAGEEANDFEKAVARVVQQSRLKAAGREVFGAGQGCGSACAVFGLRNGRLFIDTLLARWCEPVLDAEGAVESLEVRYPYLALVKDPGGTEKYVCKLYRRTIDATYDATYHPAEAREDGTEPSWRVDNARTVAHNLGFCPVVWFPHLKGCTAVNDFDGKAIHEHLTDEIRAHDFALSQRHRAALYAGDPQWTEIGVQPGYNPTGSARKVEVPASTFGRPGERAHAAYVSDAPTASKARKKSPGTVWQYEGTANEVKVQLHTLPGDALKALDDHARDLRAKLAEGLGVVFIDLDNLPNESRLSGKAFESVKARQLDRVNYYRSDFGDRFLLPALGMLLRIAIVTGLEIEGLEVVKSALLKSKHLSWHAPPIDLVWGDYFQPSGEEEELLIRSAAQAITAGIATRRAVVEKLHNVLGIRDVESYMAELDKEREENQTKELEMATAMKPPAPVKVQE